MIATSADEYLMARSTRGHSRPFRAWSISFKKKNSTRSPRREIQLLYYEAISTVPSSHPSYWNTVLLESFKRNITLKIPRVCASRRLFFHCLQLRFVTPHILFKYGGIVCRPGWLATIVSHSLTNV